MREQSRQQSGRYHAGSGSPVSNLDKRGRSDSVSYGPCRQAAQAKAKAAGQRETTPRAIRHTHDLLSPQPNRWMSQLNASRAVHVVLDITVVVSRLVRGLILRHRAGRLVRTCAGLFQAVAPRLSTGSPWTGRIAAWGAPAKEGPRLDCVPRDARPHRVRRRRSALDRRLCRLVGVRVRRNRRAGPVAGARYRLCITVLVANRFRPQVFDAGPTIALHLHRPFACAPDRRTTGGTRVVCRRSTTGLATRRALPCS